MKRIRKRFLVMFFGLILTGVLSAEALTDTRISSTAYSRQYKQHSYAAKPQTQNQPSTNNFVSVPQDYPIPFIITENCSSEEVNPGEQIEIQIAKDIYISGVLVFKKGGKGSLIVKSVKPARNLGKGGYIIFRNGYINDTTGILREITFKKKYSGKRCQWAGIIGHAMIWNPVGWIVGLKEGEPLSIKSGTEGVATLKYGFQINKKI